MKDFLVRYEYFCVLSFFLFFSCFAFFFILCLNKLLKVGRGKLEFCCVYFVLFVLDLELNFLGDELY